MMNTETVESYPEFEYNDTMSYENNFWRWRDMADYEAKCSNQPYYTEEEAKKIFQQQWGYKSKGVAL
tara:strand:- start:77 stop:277 length:201 start_codon:yes stop_codon:yes gene_type:complete